MAHSMVRSIVDAPPVVDGAGPGLDPADLFPATGRHTYVVVVEDRRIVELRAADQAPAALPDDSPFGDREWVAKILGCHPDKLSRDRRRLEAAGLVGRKLNGRRIMWRKEDVIAYAARVGLTGKRKPGRPRKAF
jgi:hypothetical protein